MDNLLLDLKYAVRTLRRHGRSSLVAVLVLALGIGASTIVFSLFYNLFFNTFSARDSNRLVVPIFQNEETREANGAIHLADLDVIRQQSHAFEGMTGYSTEGGVVLANDGHRRYQFSVSRVTSDAFNFYGVPPLLGRGIVPDDGKPGADGVFVISYNTWKEVFDGDRSIVGRTFTVDDEVRTLAGIMPPQFHAFGPITQEIWLPIGGEPAISSDAQPSLLVLARLKRGVSLAEASADLDVVVKDLAKTRPGHFPKHVSARVESATDALLGPSAVGAVFHSDVKHLLYDLFAAVMMLLLIACTNVANLLLARATVREREIALQYALGATRTRIVRQLFVETSVLAIAACLLGCILASPGTRVVAEFLPKTLGASLGSNIGAETTLDLNLPVLLFAMGAAILTSIMCGLAPAFHAAQGNLQSPLSSAAKGTSSGPRHSRLRGALVVSEVALSIVLLVGAMLLMRSFYLLTHVDLGFNPKNVLFVAFLPPPSHATSSPIQRFAGTQGQAVLRDVVDRLKKIPGVTEVSIEDTMPGYGPGAGPRVMVPGSAHPDEEAGLLACDENFARTLELRSTQGRWLSRDEVDSAQHVAVINEKLAADFFGAGTTVGKQIKVKAFKGPFRPPEDTYFQIVGVVHDMKNNGPQQPAMPIIFLPYTVRGGFFLLLKTAVNPASLKSAIQQRIWAVDPNEIVGLSGPLTDFLQRNTYATPEFAVLLSAPLSGIALLVAATGIFSVMAYTVSLRTHEIGVRMALGAQRANVVNMVVAEGGGLIASGIVIGLLASYALTRFLASQVWGISSTDPWTFAMVVTVVLLAGISACLIPAYRAARVDPCEALRHE